MNTEQYTEEVERILDEANLFASALCFYDAEKDNIEVEFIHNGSFYKYDAGAVTRRIKLNTTPKQTAQGLAYKVIQQIFDKVEEGHV